MLRCLIDKVVVHRIAPDRVHCRVVWKGGEATDADVTVTVGSWSRLSKGREIEESILRLARQGKSDEEIARYLTERGHKIYSEDLLEASTDPSLITKNEHGQVVLDSRRFLADNLVYPAAQFDIVLCWNLADYMDEGLVKPVVARLWSTIKPGGMLLAFFHTREAGPDAPCYRYHIVGNDVLEMQHAVTQVRVDESLVSYALGIVRKTRESEQFSLGVSPRGSQMLYRAAQAMAFLDGRMF